MPSSLYFTSVEGTNIPFKSKAQQRYLHANPDKVGGKDKLKEWDSATDFSKLPERKKKFSRASKKT